MVTATGPTSSNTSTAPERPEPANGRPGRANAIRIKRAQLKRDLKAGRLDRLAAARPAGVPRDREGLRHAAGRAEVRPVKVNKILVHCRIAPSKTIGGLSERQRSELVSLLRH